MKKVQKLFINLTIEGENQTVGELVRLDQKIYFRYDKDFLLTGLNLSPIKLKFTDEVQEGPNDPFEGLIGVFNDSLPDGWGRLLLDRRLSAKGVLISEISPMERLAYVGKHGMGALTYSPAIEEDDVNVTSIDLDFFEAEMKQILQGDSSEIIDELLVLNGSSGGAQPKILVSYNPEIHSLIYNEDKYSRGYESWIIKFPSSQDHSEIAKIEFAYYKMAKMAGIEMTDSHLFISKNGRFYFGTKRFDRNKNGRLHVHSAAGLMNDNFRISTMDYGHLMDCAFRLEKHFNAYRKVLRLAAFNVFSHNQDDHSKNFSFLMNSKGEWQLAPAYDLTFSQSNFGFHSTMVAGESQRPGESHLLELARHFGLKDGIAIIDEVREAISKWSEIARECEISDRTIQSIQSRINAIGK